MNPQTVFAFLFVLGGLIFIHELGHFLVAKMFGIGVEVFSLGFGPRLFGFRRGRTDYRVSLLPLGGYVKMVGENPEESRSGSSEEFLSRSKVVRFLVLVMGAGMNLVLAVVIYWIMYMAGVQEPAYLRGPAVVGEVREHSPAAEAGLQPGDEVLVLGGEAVTSWLDFSTRVQLSPNTETVVRVRRGGEELTLPLAISVPPLGEPGEKYGMGYVGVIPHVAPLVFEIEPGSPAEAAGFQVGDLLVGVQGERLFGPRSREIAIDAILAHPGSPVAMQVNRDGRVVDLEVVPEEVDGTAKIGVMFSFEMTRMRYGPAQALVASLQANWRSTGLLFTSLRKVVRGELSLRAMSGPVDIYKFSGEAFRGGWQPFFMFMALVSLNLGIINLLPIPVLDGGHIFVLLIEGALRRDLSMRVKEQLMTVGFIFLVTFMGVVISLDLIKNFL